jgi:hypothetical protein
MRILIDLVKYFLAAGILAFGVQIAISAETQGTVYNVHRGVDFGDTDTPPEKDYFIGLGAVHGLSNGATVDVYRKIASFDNLTKKFAGDVEFKFARLRVIHVEKQTAITRLEAVAAHETTPVVEPAGIMVGDVVRPSRN